MISKGASFFAVGLATGLLIATCAFALLVRTQDARQSDAGGAVTVLKLAHGLDEQHPVHRAMVYMNELLQEKSGGTVHIDIYPSGQLGSETECIEQLQRGSIDMTKTSTAPLESFTPEMAVFGVPYLFRDEEHFWKVLDGEIGDELLRSGEASGMHGLCYYDAGARSFYTVDRPILKPSDLDRLKIRVQESDTAMTMVETLGGQPTPMEFGELFTSLQQGVVDGAENNPPSFHTTRHSEVCKHYSLDEHTRVPDMLLFSQEKWQQLSPQVQQWVQEAADASSIRQRELWKQKTAESLAAVEAEGVTIYRPDKTPFAEAVQPMHAQYAGTQIGELMRRISEVE